MALTKSAFHLKNLSFFVGAYVYLYLYKYLLTVQLSGIGATAPKETIYLFRKLKYQRSLKEKFEKNLFYVV